MNSEGKYYKYNADAKTIDWVTLGENEALADAITEKKITEYVSDANGAVTPFAGLV